MTLDAQTAVPEKTHPLWDVATPLVPKWVKLPCPLRHLLSRVLPLGMFGLDTPGGVTDGEAAEFVGFGTRQAGSRVCVAGGAVWVDGAHSELIAACLLGSKLTG